MIVLNSASVHLQNGKLQQGCNQGFQAELEKLNWSVVISIAFSCCSLILLITEIISLYCMLELISIGVDSEISLAMSYNNGGLWCITNFPKQWQTYGHLLVPGINFGVTQWIFHLWFPAKICIENKH